MDVNNKTGLQRGLFQTDGKEIDRGSPAAPVVEKNRRKKGTSPVERIRRGGGRRKETSTRSYDTNQSSVVHIRDGECMPYWPSYLGSDLDRNA